MGWSWKYNMAASPNILVVEGDKIWQQTLCEILDTEGHKPYPAATYKEVDQIVRHQPFDVAVINPILSTSSGFSPKDLLMLQKIRQLNPAIEIIVVSHPLAQEVRESISQIYPAPPFLSKEHWDKNYFISLVKSFAGEGPNTDDKRLRSILERSQYGTRPLTPPALEHGVGNPRILCVEGRQDWQKIFIELFNTEAYFWRMAATPDHAWRTLENESFHLLIINEHFLPISDDKIESQLLDYLIEFRPKTKALVIYNANLADEKRKRLAEYSIVVGFLDKQAFDPDMIKHAVIEAIQAPKLVIESFGVLKVWRGQDLIGHWPNSQAEILFKILLTRQANGGQAVSARDLVTMLWPKPDIEDYNKLLPLINEVRLTLEPGIEPRETSFILRSSTGYHMDIGGQVEWDVLEFRELRKQGKYFIDLQQWGKALNVLEKARACYRDDYLADEDAGWVVDVRRQLSKEFTGVLTDLADVYAAYERYDEAIEVCLETLVADPLVESVYRRLMRFYYWKGQKAEAIRTYRMCVKLFEELFGESPKPITRQLHEEILEDKEIINILL
jgi:two-component SAPR family response regulator/CheY-like chemotaxis protein